MKRLLLSIFSLGLLTSATQVSAQTEALTKFTESFAPKKVTSARAKKAPETPDSLINLFWNVNKYDTSDIVHFEYNQDGLKTQSVLKLWGNGSSYEVDRTTFRYDANKNEIARFTETKVGEEWYPSSLDTSVYDAEGYQTLHLQQYFDGMEWQTTNGEKYTMEYEQVGSKNLPQTMTTYLLDSVGGWAPMEKMESTFENGKYKEVRQFLWNDSLGEWEMAVRLSDLEFYNDRIDQPKKATIEVDLGGGMWMAILRISSTFDTDGNMLTQLMEVNNFMGGGWQNQSKTTNKYDAFGNMTETANETWEGQTKRTTVNRINLSYGANHIVLEREYEMDSTGSGTFVKTNKEVMGYENLTSISDKGRPAFEVSVYPNPASDKLYISTEGISTGSVLTLTDASGRQVNMMRIAPSSLPAQLDLNGLQPGLYIVRLQSGSAAVSKTIIKN